MRFVVGAVFQAVAITARCISMVSEASRGRESLPRLHSELAGLLKCTTQRAMIIVDPEAAMDEFTFESRIQNPRGLHVDSRQHRRADDAELV